MGGGYRGAVTYNELENTQLFARVNCTGARRSQQQALLSAGPVALGVAVNAFGGSGQAAAPQGRYQSVMERRVRD